MTTAGLKVKSRTDGQLSLVEAAGIKPSLAVRISIRLLPAFEVCLALWVLSGWLPMGALLSSAAVLTLFTGTLIAAIRAGYNGECACFGGSGDNPIPVGATEVVFNTLLICLSLIGAFFIYNNDGIGARAIWESRPFDIGLGIFLALW